MIIGHSLGAQVTLNLAAHYPEKVRGVVLLDPLVTEALTSKARSMKRKLPMLQLAESVTRAMNSLGFPDALSRRICEPWTARPVK